LEQIIGASRLGTVDEETRRRSLQKAATALCRPPGFDPVLVQASNPHSSHVSHLAQTRKPAPVIIDFPEGVDSHDR
jgi:hypothetical protein